MLIRKDPLASGLDRFEQGSTSLEALGSPRKNMERRIAYPTRFELVTSTFGGQLFDTQALDQVGTIRHQICHDGSRVARLLFVWKRLLSY
ncbi:hypothetical protein CQ10_37970 [Bradyrhizobium valentinum]|nr:hypothetical protein CQ10_37970 [Bradyrhizobium valentinum]